MRRLISLKAARKILKSDKPTGMSDTKIRQLIKTVPDFPAYLIGGEYMIDADKLDAWIENRCVAVAPSQAPKAKRGRPVKTKSKKFEVYTPGWGKFKTG